MALNAECWGYGDIQRVIVPFKITPGLDLISDGKAVVGESRGISWLNDKLVYLTSDRSGRRILVQRRESATSYRVLEEHRHGSVCLDANGLLSFWDEKDKFNSYAIMKNDELKMWSAARMTHSFIGNNCREWDFLWCEIPNTFAITKTLPDDAKKPDKDELTLYTVSNGVVSATNVYAFGEMEHDPPSVLGDDPANALIAKVSMNPNKEDPISWNKVVKVWDRHGLVRSFDLPVREAAIDQTTLYTAPDGRRYVMTVAPMGARKKSAKLRVRFLCLEDGTQVVRDVRVSLSEKDVDRTDLDRIKKGETGTAPLTDIHEKSE